MTVPAVPALRPQRPFGAIDSLRAALCDVRDPSAILYTAVPAPAARLEAVLGLDESLEAVLWHPPEGAAFASLGATETLIGRGESRFEQIRERARELFARVVTAQVPGVTAPALRCLGGFSFQPGWAESEPWRAFGDARFVLPRFTYRENGERSVLAVLARGDEVATESGRRALLESIEKVLAGLTASAERGSARRVSGERRVTRRVEASEEGWRDLVELTRSKIRAGQFEKVVVAGRSELTFAAPVDVPGVLAELNASAEASTRFAFRFGNVTFLGATPERLVRLSGLDVDTEALAGSGDSLHADELLASAKERNEHEPVIREIVRRLSPLCARLSFPATPEVRSLRHLLHLRTPVRAELARRAHVLDLVEILHPTPAVGGVPTEEAVRFIAEHEPAERGWYASPIGWFDASGDGEFAVGLRSGAFVGDQAYLYAGGGIVRGSDPASEYAETRLKLRTLCAALHVAK